MPNPTVDDCWTACASAWVINERLLYHSQPGRMLAGLKVETEGEFKVSGEDDLPMIQPFSVLLAEDLAPGQPRTSTVAQANAPVAETLTLIYHIATSRKHGWIRRDPTDTTAPKGFLEWLALIRDAMETTRNDGINAKPDARLEYSIVKPISFRITENETTQLAFHCYLEVTLDVRYYCRRERSYTLPPLSA